MVEGKNNDSTTADSNGAGKSTLFDALLWNMYGVTRHGSKADEVVNRFTKTGCKVTSVLSIRGMKVEIIRTRKFGSKKDTSLTVLIDSQDVTKGTAKDTQAYLDEIFGMNNMVFQKAMFFGQGDVKPFANLTDAELKLVFEQALGLTWFSDSKQKVGGYMTGIKQRIEQAKSRMALLESNKTLAETNVLSGKDALARVQEVAGKWKQSKEDELKGKTKQKDEAVYQQAVATSRSGEIEAVLTEKNTKLLELQDLRQKLSASLNENTAQLARKDSTIDGFKLEIKALQNRIKAIEAKQGAACTECYQQVSPELVGKVKGVLENQVATINGKAQEASKDLQETRGKKDQQQGLADKLEMSIRQVNTDVTTLTAEKAQCDATATSNYLRITQLTGEITRIEEELATGEEQQRAALEQSEKKQAMLQAELDVCVKQIEEAEKENVTDVEKLAKVKLLHDALGNGGVKSYIFDSITPAINEHANKYIQILDPAMSVEVSTVTKLASGDFREKFSIKVGNENGANSLSGSSGGERQKVNLSVALAFNNVMRSMAGGDVPLMVLDEPFESLDAGSSDMVLELLGHIQADNLYLITHNPSVKDLVPGRMVVEKKNKVATITEYI